MVAAIRLGSHWHYGIVLLIVRGVDVNFGNKARLLNWFVWFCFTCCLGFYVLRQQ